MADPNILFACGPYDRMRPLADGRVKPAGLALTYESIQLPRVIFDNMARDQAYDASELSASEFISQRGVEAAGGKPCPFVAIPVFPSKAFRHGFICVNTKAGIKSPKDLEGKRVGVPLYTQTAAIFLRGHLAHDYGVNLDKIHWVQGAIEHAGSHGNPAAPPLLKPIDIEIAPNHKSLSEMLSAGEIDATLGSRLPTGLGRDPNIARLWPNSREVEKDFYKRTKIHPIMHLVALKKSVHEAHPHVAASLYKALNEAKDMALSDLKFDAAPHTMLPWQFSDIEEFESTFGPDPWPYGVEANRATLEALMTYMVEQHFIAKPIPLEQLFVKV
jgi:4,5-dihydroxyphthalate decarboxylase